MPASAVTLPEPLTCDDATSEEGIWDILPGFRVGRDLARLEAVWRHFGEQ
jgi:hypothetical protein